MSFSYNRLWKLTIDKGINKTQLRDRAKLTNQTLARLSKNQNVSMDVLDRICGCLNCNVEDIIERNKENGEENGKN
ncbi:helix-turn-helix transcriptional regulator [Exiguobacterium sp. s192]|uniref:helix-turn-helix domain-containing protein n=1 Tax=Exiguobacterium TaxID=33986 RepID=UPI001BE8F956|nr:helix-turn-helix transcriptional regulator [Exiguobacterium sp. s192]